MKQYICDFCNRCVPHVFTEGPTIRTFTYEGVQISVTFSDVKSNGKPLDLCDPCLGKVFTTLGDLL